MRGRACGNDVEEMKVEEMKGKLCRMQKGKQGHMRQNMTRIHPFEKMLLSTDDEHDGCAGLCCWKDCDTKHQCHDRMCLTASWIQQLSVL